MLLKGEAKLMVEFLYSNEVQMLQEILLMPTRWATSSIWFKSAGDLQSICSIPESVLATSDKRQEYDLFPICIKTGRKVITGLVISDLHTLGHKCICDA